MKLCNSLTQYKKDISFNIGDKGIISDKQDIKKFKIINKISEVYTMEIID